MTLRQLPLTVPDQIADIYMLLRRLRKGLTAEDIDALIADRPCDCPGCTQIPVEKSFFEAGIATLENSQEIWFPLTPVTITSVRITAATVPTNATTFGPALIVDINRNGTTIFTNQANRPTLRSGETTVLAPGIDDPIGVVGDYYTFDIDQIGDTIPGSDITIQIGYLIDCSVFPNVGIGPGTPTPTCYDDWVLTDAPLLFYMMDEASGTVVTDASGHGYHGTYNGGPALRQAGPLACRTSYGVLFHDSGSYPWNSSQYVQLPSIPLNVKAVTIEGWFQQDSAGTGGGNMWDIGTGTNYVNARPNIASTLNRVGDTGTLSDIGAWWTTSWTHFVVVIDRNAGTIKQYVNGVLQTTTTDPNTSNFWASPDIGAIMQTRHSFGSGSDPYLAGYVSRFAVYDYALTATQIANHYATR